MAILRREQPTVRPKTLGVVEAMVLATNISKLVDMLQRIAIILLDRSGRKAKSRRDTLVLLGRRLKGWQFISNAELPGAVGSRLEELSELAEELEERVSSGLGRRFLKATFKGRFEKRLALLRTGLDDIENALKAENYISVSNFVEASLAAPSHATAPASARVQNVTFNGPVTFNVFESGDGEALEHHHVQAVPALAYPAQTPSDNPPKIGRRRLDLLFA